MSTYTLQVSAESPQDATDIAKRRAREDGYRTLTVRRVTRVAPPVPVRWSVELAVVRP